MADYNSDRTGSNIDLTLDKVDALDAKVQPTATGVDVTGTLTADGLTVDGDTIIGSTSNTSRGGGFTRALFKMGVNQTYLDIQAEDTTKVAGLLFSDGASGDYGLLTYDHSNDSMSAFTSSSERMKINSNGDVHFYEDTGTTAKFVWDASAESLGIGGSPDTSRDVTIQNNSFASLKIQGGGSGDAFTQFTTNSNEAYVGLDESLNVLKLNNTNTLGSESHLAIDTSGNVGIGTASPSGFSQYKGLTISDSAGGFVEMKSTTGSITAFISADNGAGGGVVGTRTNDPLQLRTNDTERARIDSSGNLLVGTTSQATWDSTVGTSIRANAATTMTASGGNPLYLNRLSNDGDLITFHRGSTAKVGSIGVSSTNTSLYMGKINTGLMFWDAQSAITPCNNAGVVNNGAVDLGTTNYKFRDLRLSGGVYLGGTGSANKLDDYETGTWTPTTDSGTITYSDAVYTKIGRVVTITIESIEFSDTTTSQTLKINSLPFTSSTASVGSVMASNVNTPEDWDVCYVPANQSYINFYANKSLGFSSIKRPDLKASNSIYLQITYETDS